MSIDLKKYLNNIDAIITTSNPDEISPKKIRKCLEELYGIKLDKQRKALNELIIDRFNELTEHPKVLVSKLEWDDANKWIEQKKIEFANEDKVSKRQKLRDSSIKKPRKKYKKQDRDSLVNEDGSKKKGISWEVLNLSSDLQNVIGPEPRPRTQVVKDIWKYIKEHNLQNPDNGREIICDSKLEPIFGKETTMFQLHKFLSDHLTHQDE
ncbi:protein Tri1p [Monosporozyma unispora]|nr:hypothetical protein C6P44_002079 [Kazachstania unispora]